MTPILLWVALGVFAGSVAAPLCFPRTAAGERIGGGALWAAVTQRRRASPGGWGGTAAGGGEAPLYFVLEQPLSFHGRDLKSPLRLLVRPARFGASGLMVHIEV